MSELPLISILTPTYNRHKFLPLYLHNLKNQTYPHNKLEVCIDDDGTEPFCIAAELQAQIYPMKLIYHRDNNRRSIGEKRNYLVKKLASSKIVCFMDDDDIYNPNYIHYSHACLRDNKVGLVGSNSMLFTYPALEFKITGIRCEHLCQIHEATMLFTKKYFRSVGGFEKTSQGEGASFVLDDPKKVYNTDINNVMICVGHDGNSVDKTMFNDDSRKLADHYEGSEVEILKEIMRS